MKRDHEVRLIPPWHVKPLVRRGAKNDAANAAVISEAVRRPGRRFVPVKSEANESFLTSGYWAAGTGAEHNGIFERSTGPLTVVGDGIAFLHLTLKSGSMLFVVSASDRVCPVFHTDDLFSLEDEIEFEFDNCFIDGQHNASVWLFETAGLKVGKRCIGAFRQFCEVLAGDAGKRSGGLDDLAWY